MRKLDFYTDGAYSSRSEMGGWAAICVENNEIIDRQSGYEPYTTNNRMELMAVLSALENIDTIETANTKVCIHTDSAYIANCFRDKWYVKWMSNNWKTSDKQPVKNQDLWKRIIALYIRFSSAYNLQIEKIEAHNGNEYNEIVDSMAVAKRKELEK